MFEGLPVIFTASHYLELISRYSGTSPCCIITALLYLERYKVKVPAIIMSSRTLQRLLLVSVMIATKYLEDDCCLNFFW